MASAYSNRAAQNKNIVSPRPVAGKRFV